MFKKIKLGFFNMQGTEKDLRQLKMILIILTQKMLLRFQKYGLDPGSEKNLFRIPGSKKHRSATLNKHGVSRKSNTVHLNVDKEKCLDQKNLSVEKFSNKEIREFGNK